MKRQTKSYSILIVEDDAEIIILLDRIFSCICPFADIEWSTNAEEAILLVENKFKNNLKNPFDIIIIDYFLEGVKTGHDFLHDIKNIYPKISCVMISVGNLNKIFKLNNIKKDIHLKLIKKPLNISYCTKVLKDLLYKN